jgi:hypothetical protein
MSLTSHEHIEIKGDKARQGEIREINQIKGDKGDKSDKERHREIKGGESDKGRPYPRVRVTGSRVPYNANP